MTPPKRTLRDKEVSRNRPSSKNQLLSDSSFQLKRISVKFFGGGNYQFTMSGAFTSMSNIYDVAFF